MITDGMVEAALVIASPGRNAVDGDDATWQSDLTTMETMRAALEAVAPMIRAVALEEAAKVADEKVATANGYAERAIHTDMIRQVNIRAAAYETIAEAIRALKEPT